MAMGTQMTSKIRSSPPEVLLGKGVLEICSKLTEVDKQNYSGELLLPNEIIENVKTFKLENM